MPEIVTDIVRSEIVVDVFSGGAAVNPPAPVAVTVDISGNPDLGSITAVLRGIVQDFGYACIAWFEYSGAYTTAQTAPSLSNSTPTQQFPGLAINLDYYWGIDGLTADRFYYFRAVAQNANGMTFGVTLEFQTYPTGGSLGQPDGVDPIPLQLVPTCITGSAQELSPTSVLLSAHADSGAISTLTQLNMYYRVEGTSTWNGLVCTPGTTSNSIALGGQDYTAPVTVTAGVPYEFHAEATNSNGTTVGDTKTFTTTPPVTQPPHVTTEQPDNFDATHWDLNATADAGVGSKLTRLRCYYRVLDLPPYPTFTQVVPTPQDITSATPVTSEYRLLTALEQDIDYYFTAENVDSPTPVNGGLVSFYTGDPPVLNIPECQTITQSPNGGTSYDLNGAFRSGGGLVATAKCHYQIDGGGGLNWTAGVATIPPTTTSSSFVHAHFTLDPGFNHTVQFYYTVSNFDGSDGDVSEALSFNTGPAPGNPPDIAFNPAGGLGSKTQSTFRGRGAVSDFNVNPTDFSTTAMRYRVNGTSSWTYLFYTPGGLEGNIKVNAIDIDPTLFQVTASNLAANTQYEFQMGAGNQYTPANTPPFELGHRWTSSLVSLTNATSSSLPQAVTLGGTVIPGPSGTFAIRFDGTFNAGSAAEPTDGSFKYKRNNANQFSSSGVIATTTFANNVTIQYQTPFGFVDNDIITFYAYAQQPLDGTTQGEASGQQIVIQIDATPGVNLPDAVDITAPIVTDTTAEIQVTLTDTSITGAQNLNGLVSFYWKKNLDDWALQSGPQTWPYDSTITPFTNLTHLFSLSNLTANTEYDGKLIVQNSQGSDTLVISDSVSVFLFKTVAGGTGNVVLGVDPPAWVGPDMATLRGHYTLQGLATSATLSWQYKRLQDLIWSDVKAAGVNFTEVVTNTSAGSHYVDACVAGLAVNTPYEFRIRGLPNVGTLQTSPTNSAANFLTFTIPPTIGTSNQPVWIGRGVGPGTRGTPVCASGQSNTLLAENPDEDWTHTYACPQRPSSGFIRLDNQRHFTSNLYYNTINNGGGVNYYTVQQALYSGGSYVSHKGYDIIVWGIGNVAGRTPFTIEIWNPAICAQLGSTVPATITAASGGAGDGAVLGKAIAYYSRWGDVIGVSGYGLFSPCWGGNSDNAAIATWEENVSGQGVRYHNLAHITLHGMVAPALINSAFRGFEMHWCSNKGSFHDIAFRYRLCTNGHTPGAGSGGANWFGTMATWMRSVGGNNSFTYDANHFRTIGKDAVGGLVSLIDSRQEWDPTLSPTPGGVKWVCRGQGAQLRLEIRRCVLEYSGERHFYQSFQAARRSHTERLPSGRLVAGPSIYDDITEFAGAVAIAAGRTSTRKQVFQMESRCADDSSSQPHSGASGGNDLGQVGTGVVVCRNVDCKSWDNTDFNPDGTKTGVNNGTYTLIGHGGWFVIINCKGNNCLNIYSDDAKNHGVAPIGMNPFDNTIATPNGTVFANRGLWIQSYTVTRRSTASTFVPNQKAGIVLDALMHARIDSITMLQDVPHTWPSGTAHIRIVGYNNYNPPNNDDVWLIPTNQNQADPGQVVNPTGQPSRVVGLVELKMPGNPNVNQPATWPGWNPLLLKVIYGARSGDTAMPGSGPPINCPSSAGYTWTDADINAAYNGIGLEYQSGTVTLQPTNQPGSYTFPYRQTLPVAGEDF